jgi:hypothetical protein
MRSKRESPHVSCDFEHTNSVTQRRHCIKMTEAVETIFLAEAVPLYSSFSAASS